MAVFIEANYSKKLGLPGFSSHQYSVTLKTELKDLSLLEKTNSQLYRLLQDAVDSQITEVGFLGDLQQRPSAQEPRVSSRLNGSAWTCSEKQKSLILGVVEDHRLDLKDIENLARDRFNKPLKTLNRLEASGIINELLERYGNQKQQHGDRRPARSGSSR